MTQELFEAIENRDLDRLARLLGENANPNAARGDDPDDTPLDVAIDVMLEDGGPVEAVVLLLRHGAKCRAGLHAAIHEDCGELLLLLLAAGFPLNSTNVDGETPLRLCATYGRVEMTETLLRCGASQGIDESGGYAGSSALGRAVYRLNLPLVKLLLKWGANPMAEDVDRQIAREHLPCRHDSNAQTWDEIASLLPSRKRRE